MSVADLGDEDELRIMVLLELPWESAEVLLELCEGAEVLLELPSRGCRRLGEPWGACVALGSSIAT